MKRAAFISCAPCTTREIKSLSRLDGESEIDRVVLIASIVDDGGVDARSGLGQLDQAKRKQRQQRRQQELVLLRVARCVIVPWLRIVFDFQVRGRGSIPMPEHGRRASRAPRRIDRDIRRGRRALVPRGDARRNRASRAGCRCVASHASMSATVNRSPAAGIALAARPSSRNMRLRFGGRTIGSAFSDADGGR